MIHKTSRQGRCFLCCSGGTSGREAGSFCTIRQGGPATWRRKQAAVPPKSIGCGPADDFTLNPSLFRSPLGWGFLMGKPDSLLPASYVSLGADPDFGGSRDGLARARRVLLRERQLQIRSGSHRCVILKCGRGGAAGGENESAAICGSAIVRLASALLRTRARVMVRKLRQRRPAINGRQALATTKPGADLYIENPAPKSQIGF
jgi:hypothetical protein